MPDLLPLTLGARRSGRIRPELGPLRRTLAELGDPQLACPSVLIVGTNGKGSTAVMLDAVLRAHGVRTGLTTSPHLVSPRERIRIAGAEIQAGDLERQLGRLAAFPELTFFETVTAAAFLAFAEAGVGLAVLEAGMGGSWDATRVAESAVAGITNVGTDHASWLGATVGERARDKGAALAAARRAVIGPGLDPGLVGHLRAPDAVPAGRLVSVEAAARGRLGVEWDGCRFEVESPLVGDHQAANLHLALALARAAADAGFAPRLEPRRVIDGLAGLSWPGRLTEHLVCGRRVLIDGAHNPEGACALAAHLAALPGRRNLLFSCLDDKEVEAMAAALEPVVASVVVCSVDDERAMAVDRIAAAFDGATVKADPLAALEALPDPVVAAGSLRLAGRLIGAAQQGEQR